jgi:hypothetical protein
MELDMGAVPSVIDALMVVTAAQLATLHLGFPAWGIWPPANGQWTAVRPAAARPPAPALPMIWVQAATPAELAARMRAADQQPELLAGRPSAEHVPVKGTTVRQVPPNSATRAGGWGSSRLVLLGGRNAKPV